MPPCWLRRHHRPDAKHQEGARRFNCVFAIPFRELSGPGKALGAAARRALPAVTLRGQAAGRDHVLRHGQRAARMRTAWSRSSPATGKSRPDSIRLAPCCSIRGPPPMPGLNRSERGPRRLHHHSAAWVEHACTGETSAGRIWQQCQITQAKGKRRQVRYVDESVNWTITRAPVRQLIVTGLRA